MRKMKKINGFLVVRFNDREKRDNPTLGSFGVINAEDYTGDIDYDLDAFEYTDADLIEVAVEQARGLNAEEDFGDEATTYTVIAETAEKATEEQVEPKLLALGWQERLAMQVKSKRHPDIDPRTAAHELNGYKAALVELGLMEADDAVVKADTFGEACEFYDDEGHRVDIMLPSPAGLALASAHDYEEGETFTGCTVQVLKCRRCGRESFAWSKGTAPEQEETLAYVCDELCRFREGRTQEELDAICEKCKLESWARGRAQEPEQGARYHLGKPGPSPAQEKAPEEPKLRTGFDSLPEELGYSLRAKRVYALGLVLADECPDNDCKVYLNTFNMARSLDDAIAGMGDPESYPALVLRQDLRKLLRELTEMYLENYAVQKFKEGMQPRETPILSGRWSSPSGPGAKRRPGSMRPGSGATPSRRRPGGRRSSRRPGWTCGATMCSWRC